MAMKALNELRNLVREPQTLHRWQVTVPQWPNVGAPANPDLMFFMTTVDLPDTNYETTKVELGGYALNFNGKEDRNGELTATFFENTDQEVTNYFFVDYANARQQFTNGSNITFQSAPTSDLIVPAVNMTLLNTDASSITKTYQLINVMFKPGTYGGTLGQQSEAQQPGVVFEYDAFVIV